MKGPPTDAIAVRRTQTWMEYLAKLIVMGTILLCVVGIICYSVDLYRHGKQKHYIGWFSAAGFVLLTIPISIRLIVQHLTHWNAPHIQKYVVRIIWMIPIYSIESWFALRFKEASIYIETIRECYEAYVIFCFMYFLIALLGDEQSLVLKLKQKPAEFGRHSWPISLVVSPWSMGNEMLQKCKFGVFQYVIIKNVIAIVVCVLASRGQYAEGKFRLDGFFLYQCFICNASQIWALYCMVLFYFATKDELAPYRPVGKFLSVKTVVFFTWWQSLVINILASPLRQSASEAEADLGEQQQWTNNEISKGLQDYLICIEMFVASIAFTYAFTHRDYQSAAKSKSEEEEVKPFLSAFLQSSVPDDIIADLRRFARGNSLVKRVLGNSLDAAENYDSGSDDDEESSTHSIHSTTGLTSGGSGHGSSGSGGLGGGAGSVHNVIVNSSHGSNAVSGSGLSLSAAHTSTAHSGGSVTGTPRTTSSGLSPNNINNLVGPNTIGATHVVSTSAASSSHSVDHLLEASGSGSPHTTLPAVATTSATTHTLSTVHATPHTKTITATHPTHATTHTPATAHAPHTATHIKHTGTGIAHLAKKTRSTSAVLGDDEFEKLEKAD